ncbi:hypothetical protein [Brevibacillus sp. IT-7CA2]|uniref:hypothetical protein n=1 Tax=Brevibacillus sp. IT-7CA2 TaxID=3026436 RepID=UPI0039DF9114
MKLWLSGKREEMNQSASLSIWNEQKRSTESQSQLIGEMRGEVDWIIEWLDCTALTRFPIFLFL